MNAFPPGAARWIDLSRDLPSLADLLAVAFAERLDADARAALRQLRRIARDRRAQRVYAAREIPGAPLYGYVWEAEGRIVGNVSLIPLQAKPKQYLIVNVAVLPSYRRRGIARALMQRALAYAQERHASRVWLQVDDDNVEAIHLYETLGFTSLGVEVVWQRLPDADETDVVVPAPHVQVRRGLAGREAWPQQLAWMEAIYPPERAWHRPIPSWQALAPTFRGWLWRLVHPLPFRQWTLWREDAFQGGFVWLPRQAAPSDAALFATPPDMPPAALAALLHPFLRRQRRPLRAALPDGFLADALPRLGFVPIRRLLWMLWQPPEQDEP